MCRESLNESQWKELVDFYRNGASINECKRLYFISTQKIKDKLKEYGVFKAMKIKRGRFAHIK